jgi:hypothetical protein
MGFARSLVVGAVLALMPLVVAAQDAMQVAASKLGKGVENREITEEATTFAVNEKAYLWMRVTGGEGQSVKVNWRTGDITDTVTLDIGGNSWRTWSSKTLWQAGAWTVTVTGPDDAVLAEIAFTVE